MATNAAYAASRSWQVRQVGGGGRGVLAGQLLVEFLRLVRLHGEVVDLEADPVAGVASAPKPPPEGPTSQALVDLRLGGASVLPALFGWPGRTPAIPAISLPGSVFEVRQRRVGGQQGDPDYKSSQDRDGDGIACEG